MWDIELLPALRAHSSLLSGSIPKIKGMLQTSNQDILLPFFTSWHSFHYIWPPLVASATTSSPVTPDLSPSLSVPYSDPIPRYATCAPETCPLWCHTGSSQSKEQVMGLAPLFSLTRSLLGVRQLNWSREGGYNHVQPQRKTMLQHQQVLARRIKYRKNRPEGAAQGLLQTLPPWLDLVDSCFTFICWTWMCVYRVQSFIAQLSERDPGWVWEPWKYSMALAHCELWGTQNYLGAQEFATLQTWHKTQCFSHPRG